MSESAYIAMGGNLGDRLGNLTRALQMIEGLPDTHITRVSSVYETEPWGVEGQPLFANAVAEIRTSLDADVLLAHLQEIEESLGRVREERYGPRSVDLDILMYGDEEWRSDHLTIPHPRMLEREFVVVPLLEIAPDASLPDGSPVTRERATFGRITGALGAIPGWEHLTPMSGGASCAGVAAEEWVEVASSQFVGRTEQTPDLDLLFCQAVLESEGIPYAYDPFSPAEGANPWGLSRPVRLLVPAQHALRARRVLSVALAAPPAPPDSQL